MRCKGLGPAVGPAIGPAVGLVAALALAASAAAAAPVASAGGWVGSWASSQLAADGHDALDPGELADATLRQVVHLSVGGARLRVRISNAFGTAPLTVSAVHVARAMRAGSAAIDPATDHALSFDGRPQVTVPAGAEYWSDPVDLSAPALSDVAVSLHLDAAPARQTGHPGSRTTSFIAHGDRTAAADLPDARADGRWFLLSGVDVAAGPAARAAVVALGDSITDGAGTTKDANDRWPDDLARRLQADPRTRGLGVLNAGIGGNHMLTDGIGPNAVARFDRDVLAQSGGRWVILLEGINDLGGATREGPIPPAAHAELLARLFAAYRQVIDDAHAHGLKVMGATVTPDGGNGYYHPDAAAEADRQQVNAWLRAPGRFDALVDFDAVVRDPSHPDRLRPEADSGDHLHPGPEGYRMMAAAIPIEVFTR